MTEDLLSHLRRGAVLVADGAVGTGLQAAGLAPGAPAEEWVIERPDAVLGLHRSFVDAGSDIILTCSFGGNGIRLRRSKYAGRVADINRTAAQVAIRAAREGDRRVFVGGSMGPTGELIEPYGTITKEQVTEAFAAQAAALAEGGVDFLILETFFAIEEVLAAIEGVQRTSDLPLICSFSYDRGERTMMGVSPRAMAEALGDRGLVALGANCGRGPGDMTKIVRELAAATTLPLWVKPNAGVPEGDPPAYRLTPDEMASHAVEYCRDGARIVGGCCGSTPEHVRAIAAALGRR